jgi:regulator of replication initiation timing
MPFSLTQAAEATGKVRSTIFKACKNGKISYSKDMNGQILIEPSELFRVFPPVDENVSEGVERETNRTLGNSNENNLLTQEVKFLREKLADLQRMTDAERQTAAERIEDMKRDRDRLLKVIEEQVISMRLLTDQRQPAPAPEPATGTAAKPAGGFWRLFRLRPAA